MQGDVYPTCPHPSTCHPQSSVEGGKSAILSITLASGLGQTLGKWHNPFEPLFYKIGIFHAFPVSVALLYTANKIMCEGPFKILPHCLCKRLVFFMWSISHVSGINYWTLSKYTSVAAASSGFWGPSGQGPCAFHWVLSSLHSCWQKGCSKTALQSTLNSQDPKPEL